MSIKQGPLAGTVNLHENVKHRIIGIVTAEWNIEITGNLKDGCVKTLREFGVSDENIIQKFVPGAFELPLGGQFLAEYTDADAVICLGCLIKGETPHFHYISDAVSHQIINLGTKYNKPFIFGVLTVDTEKQAFDRIGGQHGHKGEEAALAALQMLSFKEELLGKAGK